MVDKPKNLSGPSVIPALPFNHTNSLGYLLEGNCPTSDGINYLDYM
jgi:hypothetical protein